MSGDAVIASIVNDEVFIIAGAGVGPQGPAGPTGPAGPAGSGGAFQLTLSGNTSGALALVSSGTLTLVGGANVTLSQAGNAITISGGGAGAQSNQTLGIYGVSQTTGQSSSSTLDARSVSINGMGAISAGLSGGSIVISAPNTVAQSVQTQNVVDVTLSGNTSGALVLVSSGTLTLAGGNNITLSQAGNAITISGPSTVAQSNQTEGWYAVGNTTGESSSTTRDARSISVDGAGIVSAGFSGGSLRISATVPAQTVESQSIGMSNLGNTSGTTGIASGGQVQMLFAGGNNITLSQSLNGASGTITISAPNAVAQSAQTVGLYASSQTTGQSSSSTVDARSITLVGDGAVSVGLSAGSFRISAPNTIAQTNQSIGLYGSSQTTGAASSTTVDARSITFVGQGAVSVGASNGSWQISAPNTIAQTNQSLGIYASSQTTGQSSSSTYDARSLSIVGDGAVSIGWSGGSLRISAPNTIAQTNQSAGWYAVGNTTQNSSTTLDARTFSIGARGLLTAGFSNGSIQLSVPDYMSRFGVNTAGFYSSSTSNMVNTSVSVVRMEIPAAVSFSRVDVAISVQTASSATANTAANVQSWFWGLYTSSGSTLTPLSAGSSTTTWTWASNTGAVSSLTGPRLFSFAMATALTPGDYYWALQCSSASTSSIGTATTALSMTVAPVFGSSNTVMPWTDIGAATNQTVNGLFPFAGMNSVSMSHTTQTMQQSQITQSGATAGRANNILILRNK